MFRSVLSVVIPVMMLAACGGESKGFVLPPGDAQQGASDFVALGCNNCHRIVDVIARAEDSPYPEVDVVLGGPVSRIQTYGELVTSIIHPRLTHSRGAAINLTGADGRSNMPDYNKAMTVQQLVDLTAFLKSTYRVWAPEYRPILLP